MPDTIELNKKSKVDWKDIGNKPTGEENNQINEQGKINNIDANTITSGEITGRILQTAKSGARVVIGGDNDRRNDIVLVDASAGGTSPITGNTSSINFTNNNDVTQSFKIQKRAGINHISENVAEFFFEKSADNSQRNYIFLGAKGDTGGYGETYTDIVQSESNQGFIVALTNADSNKDEQTQIGVVTNDYPNYSMDDGGSRLFLNHNQCDTPNDLLSGGGGILFNVNQNNGTTGTYAWFDKDAFWLGDHAIKPYTDGNTNLGDSTHGFKEIHLTSSNGSYTGKLTVNGSNGKLQWNGTDIS